MKYKKYFCFSSKVSLVMYILFILYYAFSWYNLLVLQNTMENIQWHIEHYYACIDYLETDDLKEKENIASKYSYLGFSEDTCNEIVKYETPSGSAYNIYEDFLFLDNLVFPFFIPLIVLLPFIYLISREMKNKTVKNYCLRDNYKNYVKHVFKTAYKNIFTIPIMILITFGISYLLAKGNMNPAADVGFNLELPNISFIDNPIFPIIFILTLFLGIGLYINIGLIVLARCKNFIVAIIESELIVFLMWLFGLITFGRFFNSLGINADNFNLLSIYDWSGIDNMYVYFGFNLFLFVVSLLIAMRLYKSKEKLILMCEK